MNEQQSIKKTLDVIRNALENNNETSTEKKNDNVLILNKLVKEDGTINVINDSILSKKETYEILDKKLDDVFETHLTNWLDNNLPAYLEKYFKDKDL
jgi:Golgi nucleoside diphosphatase